MDYHLSPPPCLTSTSLLRPSPSHTLATQGRSGEGTLCIARQPRTFLAAQLPPFAPLLSSPAPTLTLLCVLVHSPHPAHLFSSELTPPSLHCAPIVLRTRLYYEGFSTLYRDDLLTSVSLASKCTPEGQGGILLVSLSPASLQVVKYLGNE